MRRVARCQRFCGMLRPLAFALAAAVAPVAASAGALGPSPNASLRVLEVPPEIGRPSTADQPSGDNALKGSDALAAPRGLDLGQGVTLSPSFATTSSHDIVDPNRRRAREPWLKLTVPLNQ